MKRFKNLRYLSLSILLCAAVLLPACGKPKDEGGVKADFRYTVNNLYGIDDLGREFQPISGFAEDKEVGIFYLLWIGSHGISPIPYDVSELLKTPEGTEALWRTEGDNPLSPNYVLHHWGKPLYGYYNQMDEWVVRRHMEMLTLAGTDYLCIDNTNDLTYDAQWLLLYKVLQEMHDQGFDVPKVIFYTNTRSLEMIVHHFGLTYSKGLYKDLWYMPNGKPVIIGLKSDLRRYRPDLLEFFDVRESAWPGYPVTEDGFPWVDFNRPQKLYGEMMSVSVAQQLTHFSDAWPSSPRYNGGRTWGRGFSSENGFDGNHDQDAILRGDNFQEQWDMAIADPKVKNIHVTAFNEWVAQKWPRDRGPTWTDDFNYELSRDIEPMEGGFGDNYLMQYAQNLRRFKASDGKRTAASNEKTIKIDGELKQWDKIPAYMDPQNDARVRDSIASFSHTYTDYSNRNDIIATKIAHDKDYLYVNVEVAYELIPSSDANWMNLYINVMDNSGAGFAGYNFIVNRDRSADGKTAKIETLTPEFYGGSVAGECGIAAYEKNIVYRIPFSALGLPVGKTPKIALKVTDGLQNPDDPTDFYISGDSAPIGRYSYAYGF